MTYYYHPNHIVINTLTYYPTDPNRQKQVDDFITTRFKGQKWMSIHARGFYDDGKYTEKALKCAQKLLNDGNIEYVFFASDSERLIDTVKKGLPTGE